MVPTVVLDPPQTEGVKPAPKTSIEVVLTVVLDPPQVRGVKPAPKTGK